MSVASASGGLMTAYGRLVASKPIRRRSTGRLAPDQTLASGAGEQTAAQGVEEPGQHQGGQHPSPRRDQGQGADHGDGEQDVEQTE